MLLSASTGGGGTPPMCQWAMKVGGCQAAEMQQTAEEFCQTVVTVRGLTAACSLSAACWSREGLLC